MDDFLGEFIRAFLASFIGIGIYIWLTPSCKAQELYAISTLKSYHQDRSAGYNEKNYGIGLQLDVNKEWSILGGEYKNSFKHKSNYYGVAYQPFHEGNWSAGLFAVNVSGYLYPLNKYVFGAIPLLTWKKDKLLLNFVFIPPFRNNGLIAMQIGWQL